MPTVAFTESVSVDGVGLSSLKSVTSDNRAQSAPASVAAAKTGTLSTRTDNDTGVVAAQASHGFATSDLVDLFWSGGSRANMTATVSGNNVTLDGGSGDVLPAVSTAVTLMKKQSENIFATVASISAIVLKSDVPAIVTFQKADGTVIDSPIHLKADDNSTPKYIYTWNSMKGACPITSFDIYKVGFSHNNATTPQTTMSAQVFYD